MRHLLLPHGPARGPVRSRRSAGQGLVEYALTLSLIGILSIGGALVLGTAVADAFTSIGDSIGTPGGGTPATAAPTKTPKPTATPKPTKTPKPKATPKPTKPPKTPKPTKPPKTPKPTKPPRSR